MELTSLIRTHHRAAHPEGALHILFAISEIAPYSKSGGLADVGAALPAALAQLGHQVTVITPLYKHIDPDLLRLARRITPLSIPRPGDPKKNVELIIWEGHHPQGVRLVFVQAGDAFERDGLYGYQDDAFDDNLERFALFSRAVVEYARVSSSAFDILHANDWHTALVPVYARHLYPDDFKRAALTLTIHNLAYQGVFPKDRAKALNLPAKLLKSGDLFNEAGDAVNLLRAGLLVADSITTVSPTYAREILQDEHAFGLADTLKKREDALLGILNGADYKIWSPDHDQLLTITYDVERLNGKRQNKAALQHLFQLPIRPMLPLIGFVGRLTEQKGVELIVAALRELLPTFTTERDGFQAVFLGEGDSHHQQLLTALAEEFPRRVSVKLGYDEPTAHKIQAGADILLVPSRFEPCGLTQLYAMRYGTLPLVHATGGLADTVVDAAQGAEQGTGFVMTSLSQQDLIDNILRATTSFKSYRSWRPLMVNAMRQTFSWEVSATRYENAYRHALTAQRVAVATP